MNTRTHKQNLVIGCIVVAFGIFALIPTFSMPSNVRAFPRIGSCAMVILGLALLITSAVKLKKQTPTDEKPYLNWAALKMPAIVYGMIVLYVVGILVLGFYIATPLMLISYMWLMGIRKVWVMVLTTAVIMVLAYFIFTEQLNVPLPRGIIFG